MHLYVVIVIIHCAVCKLQILIAMNVNEILYLSDVKFKGLQHLVITYCVHNFIHAYHDSFIGIVPVVFQFSS